MQTSELKELSKVININRDAYEFYSSAQEKAKSEALKDRFLDLKSLHEGVANKLKSYVEQTGSSVDVEQTMTGQTAEFWAMLMAKISNDIDETLVTHLEEAEDRCLHSMQDAIESDAIRPSTKIVLQNELSSLRKSHDYVKALKDSMKHAA